MTARIGRALLVVLLALAPVGGALLGFALLGRALQ